MNLTTIQIIGFSLIVSGLLVSLFGFLYNWDTKYIPFAYIPGIIGAILILLS